MGLRLGWILSHKEERRRPQSPQHPKVSRTEATQCLLVIFLSTRQHRLPGRDFPARGLHLSLLVLRVGLAVDEPTPAPLDQVAALAPLLEDALGLEAQGWLLQAEYQARGEERGRRAGGRTDLTAGARVARRERGEREATQVQQGAHGGNHFP